MFNETVTSAFTSLAPFWSNELVKVFSLGNEYTMAINMILAELIKLSSGYLTEDLTLYLFLMFVFVLGLSCMGYKFEFKFWKPRSITVIAHLNSNSTTDITEIPIVFRALNRMLIRNGLVDLRYIDQDTSEPIVSDIKNHKVKKDLFVTIVTSSTEIRMTLSSYYLDLVCLTNQAVENYSKDFKHSFILTGIEKEGVFNYPPILRKLSTIFITKFNLNRLKIMTNGMPIIKENNGKKQTEEKENNKEKNKCEETTKCYLVDDCSNVLLEKDVYLSVKRYKETVKYVLRSQTTNLQKFVHNCLESYGKSADIQGYKSSITISGIEIMDPWHGTASFNYPNTIVALCDYLICEKGYTKYHMIPNKSTGKTIKMIQDLEDVYVDDVIINTSREDMGNTTFSTLSFVKFKLESNKVDLEYFLEGITRDYEEKQRKLNHDKIYYFKYQGYEGKKPNFSVKLLSSPENPLYETFNRLSNEHTQRFIDDLEQLKDLNYYSKTGMRRKKSYLFHGEPGCGKNATVVAMALHDQRHIIDVPFSLVKYNSEFDKILNLNEIEGIQFQSDEIIYMFDEMHVGLEKCCQSISPEEQKQTMLIKKAISAKLPEGVESQDDYLDLGSVLSQLDGIKNYGGVIYVGITNYIDKIPEPLKRSLRLTPVYFTYLRREDVVKLVEQYHQIKLDQETTNSLPDRVISPSTLCQWCEQYSINDLIEKLKDSVNDLIEKLKDSINEKPGDQNNEYPANDPKDSSTSISSEFTDYSPT